MHSRTRFSLKNNAKPVSRPACCRGGMPVRLWLRSAKSAYDFISVGPLPGSFFADTCPPRLPKAPAGIFCLPRGKPPLGNHSEMF